MPPRVAHVDTERGWRGGQAQLDLFLRATAGRLEHHLLVPARSPWIQRAPEGVTVHPLPLRGRWLGARALRRRIRALAPQVVGVHTAHALALVDSGPLVVHRRVDFLPSRRALARMARARAVLAVSDAVAELLRRRGVLRVRVVYDGVDHEVPLAPAPPRPHLVAVGALVAHKDHATLLDAMRRVPVSLDVVGEGPLRARLERRCRRWGLDGRVRLVGQVDDVPARLARATALVHPSREEGLGQVVLEAMARGVPVVATRAGGLPEGVDGDGVLVPPRDPEALAGALRGMLAEHERFRRHLASVRDRRARRFGVPAMVEATLAAYLRAAG